MQIVDAVQVNVLQMPRERCLPHAKVQICRIDTRHLRPENIEEVRQLVQVPLIDRIMEQSAGEICSIQWRSVRECLPVRLLQLFAAFWSELRDIHPVIPVLESSLIDHGGTFATDVFPAG